MKLDQPIWQFYCPYCGVTRRLPFRPRPELPIHFVRLAIATAFTTLVLWEWFGIKGALSAFPIWAGFELLYRIRVRASLACGTCGFDPYLYKTNMAAARGQIEARWREKFAERGIPYPEKTEVTRGASQAGLLDPSEQVRANPVEVSSPES